MLVISCGQIPLNVGMFCRPTVWMFLGLFEYIFFTGLAQEISGQHDALSINEFIDRQGILAFEFDRTDRALCAAWAIDLFLFIRSRHKCG